MKCAPVSLRLSTKYSLLLGIRDGFPEELTRGESHSAWIFPQKVSLPLVSPHCNWSWQTFENIDFLPSFPLWKLCSGRLVCKFEERLSLHSEPHLGCCPQDGLLASDVQSTPEASLTPSMYPRKEIRTWALSFKSCPFLRCRWMGYDCWHFLLQTADRRIFQFWSWVRKGWGEQKLDIKELCWQSSSSNSRNKCDWVVSKHFLY